VTSTPQSDESSAGSDRRLPIVPEGAATVTGAGFAVLEPRGEAGVTHPMVRPDRIAFGRRDPQ
jgi:hypothetical protein